MARKEVRMGTTTRYVLIAMMALPASVLLLPCIALAAEATAKRPQFMETDPSVASGLMTATLHPYAVALQGKR
jgi:hypothetical protein